MNWKEHYARWAAALTAAQTEAADGKAVKDLKRLALEAREVLQQPDYEDLEWIIAALEKPGDGQWDERSYVRSALRPVASMSERLFKPMLWAAVYEKDPSLNRGFIEPCLRCFGVRRVNVEMMNYFCNGSDEEKAGASSAFYWSFGLNGYKDIPGEDVADLQQSVHRQSLQEFVSNSDLNVLRRIVPLLNLEPANYPEDLKSLIPQAIRIARDHPDEYIRHRIEIQLGAGGSYKPLPHD